MTFKRMAENSCNLADKDAEAESQPTLFHYLFRMDQRLLGLIRHAKLAVRHQYVPSGFHQRGSEEGAPPSIWLVKHGEHVYLRSNGLPAMSCIHASRPCRVYAIGYEPRDGEPGDIRYADFIEPLPLYAFTKAERLVSKGLVGIMVSFTNSAVRVEYLHKTSPKAILFRL